MMMPFAPMASAASQQAAEAAGRSVQDLTRGWRFHYGADTPEAAIKPVFDDSQWESVDLPHSWNRIGAYATQRSKGEGNRQGVGWYRLSLQAPAAQAGQRQYLDFAGVGNIAQVWVNGVAVGEHRGAYTRFRFDVTDVWKAGAANTIVVRADNSKPEPGSSTSEILPLAGDFFIYGGLYRGVQLITTQGAGFDLLDFGGPGVYAKATSVDQNAAEVEVLSRLRNNWKDPAKLTAQTVILDAQGKVVTEKIQALALLSNKTGELRQTLHIDHPHLWQGQVDPYRYTVAVTLKKGAQVIDKVVQPLGLRAFRFDPDKGFFLNGKSLALHGVSRHQDIMAKGAALSPQDHEADMAMIEEIGANTIRGAHYPHDDLWYDLADRRGMVMWAEVPYISASSYDGTDGTPATFVNARQQLKELIRQQFNHPSIFMWSTGNEVDASMLYLKTDRPARGQALLKDLSALAREEDPSRPTTFADCCEDSPFSRPDQEALSGFTNLTGYNRYYGWYYGKPGDYAAELDKLHAKHPALPMSISEYGAGGALTQHSDNPHGGSIAAFGRPHPEEYQSWYHEEAWKGLKSRPYLFATWVWNMFDFASDLREEGDAIDINDKGLVTFDRKEKKEAFYFYQANWSAKPMLYLTGKRYTARAYPVADVKAYSNAAKASLTVNGKRVGEADCKDGICLWPAVHLNGGSNALSVSAQRDGVALQDSVTWMAPDPEAGLSIDVGTLVGHVTADGRRYGSDNYVEGGSTSSLTPQMPRMPKGGKVVSGTSDPVLFDTYRSGAFVYTLPVPDGRWNLVLHMFETSQAMADSRSFAVKVDGMTVLDQFNPAKAAGGILKAVTKVIPITVKGGVTKVEFVKQGGSALLAGLELRRP
ncbi:beta-galactosidase [Novosphingobium sp. SG751A]|uniref:glycoside hydrolase family 2 TIM barrel-domain containing protein n=1 Tax=Novosphingobium sp. SG751A TaxID=2587000 RepID=UPI0015544F33|nr:glycoside hydrolase family 2 TIM barrel-domain containing protein [Novosphingobium sp. SG751A]NOW48462.1 beta-galactosidase [Novosphingobium sp. SG751A]